MLALALCSKPQPALFVPLVLLLVLTMCGIRKLVLGMVSGVATGLLVFLPYLSDGGKAISQMVSVMRQANPVASAQAHNLWWIVLKLQGLDPTRTPDSDPTALGVSYLGLSVI